MYSPAARQANLLEILLFPDPKFEHLRFPRFNHFHRGFTTAGSTHPPLTEPDSSPRSLTASFAPGLRGAEPYIVTTVATATRSPRSRQRSTSGNTSRIEILPPFTNLTDEVSSRAAALVGVFQ